MNLKIFAFILINVIGTAVAFENTTDTGYNELNGVSSNLLSRRKRFIIFPDGSSFQLVFCTENQGYLQVGDIVWFGNTAALAWELPTDPSIFDSLRESKKGYEGVRRHDVSKHIYFLNENGKVLSKVPYKKRPIVNPAFAKRSVDGLSKTNLDETSIKQMHERQKNVSVFLGLEKDRIIYHKESRKSLFKKIETFFQGLGLNGRECVLRMLCESGKGKREQGTFLYEIVRATFTLPPGFEDDDDGSKYVEAHEQTGDCAKMYSDCSSLYMR